jgi:hypothetical protein
MNTMTVGELRKKLESYPNDMPVMCTWEGQYAYVLPQSFSVENSKKEDHEDAFDTLVIDVN